jgi:cold shock CspA family protein
MNGIISRVIRKGREDLGGYFFVKDSQGHDRFAHARDLVCPSDFEILREGQLVEFEPMTVQNAARGNGLRAERVKLL